MYLEYRHTFIEQSLKIIKYQHSKYFICKSPTLTESFLLAKPKIVPENCRNQRLKEHRHYPISMLVQVLFSFPARYSQWASTPMLEREGIKMATKKGKNCILFCFLPSKPVTSNLFMNIMTIKSAYLIFVKRWIVCSYYFIYNLSQICTCNKSLYFSVIILAATNGFRLNPIVGYNWCRRSNLFLTVDLPVEEFLDNLPPIWSDVVQWYQRRCHGYQSRDGENQIFQKGTMCNIWILYQFCSQI